MQYVCVWMFVGLTAVASGFLMRASEPAAEPRRCCFDGQWSAVRQEIGGFFRPANDVERLYDGVTYIGYDIYQMQEASITYAKNQTDGSTLEIHDLKDFYHNVHYMKFGDQPCRELPLREGSGMFPHCIPESATLVSPAVFGYQNTSGHGDYLDVNLWEFYLQAPNGQNMIRTRLAVTAQFCVPVVQLTMGSFNGSTFDIQRFYTGYHPGIDNIQAFNKTAIGC